MSIHNIQSKLEAPDAFSSTGSFFKSPEGYTFGYGTTVGNSIQGWAPGALFIDTNAAAGSQVYINEGTSTAASFVLVGKQPVALIDDELITLGTGSDFTIGFDATNLEILPAVDDTGAVNFGDGTTDADVKVFLGATTAWALFDVGNVRMEMEGLDLLFNGTTASATMTADFSADQLDFNGVDIRLQDADELRFGDATGGDVMIAWDGTNLTSGPVTGLWAGAPSAIDPNPVIAYTFFDDFLNPASATASDYHAYTSNDDASTGTNAFQDFEGGVYNIVTAAADNDYHAMSSVAENWNFANSGKKLWFEARFRVAEATTNESAWWFGLTDTLTTGGFQADALGPLTSYDGALIWKDEATMGIDFETSNAGTQATTSAMATFVSNTWTRVGFFFDGAATTAVVTPYFEVAGTNGAMTAGTAQNITLAGLEQMHLVFGIKAGPTAGAETLQVDYIKCVQLR